MVKKNSWGFYLHQFVPTMLREEVNCFVDGNYFHNLVVLFESWKRILELLGMFLATYSRL